VWAYDKGGIRGQSEFGVRVKTLFATLKAGFAYNGLGQRVSKTTATATDDRHFLYGTDGSLRVESDGQGNILMEYFYLNDQLLAVYLPDDDGDGVVNVDDLRPVSPDQDGDGLSNLEEWYVHGTDSTRADSDNDGISDSVEIATQTDPNNPASVSGDGDINGDGNINVGDLVLLVQFVLEQRIASADEFSHADMNHDGSLTVQDILLLQKLLLQSWLNIDGQQNGPQAEPAWFAGWLDPFITPAHAVPANSGTLYYVHNDQLGTPQALTDESGVVVWSGEYDPFGKAAVDEDADADGNAVAFNVRLPGQYYDVETGLHYNYFRYYDPTTDRYLTSDPIGLQGGLNTYLYTNANPVRFTDPLGLFAGALPAPVAPPVGAPGAPDGTGRERAPRNFKQLGRELRDLFFNEDGNDSTDFPDDEPKQCRDQEKKKKNCHALKDSILSTCAGLTGRKKFACFQAAQDAFDQCMEQD